MKPTVPPANCRKFLTQSPMLDHNLIQIAGVMDEAEASMLQQCGVRYLGLPLRLTVDKEDSTEERGGNVLERPTSHGWAGLPRTACSTTESIAR